ncbi:translesion error-prone DNA polymerase V autoproteolytic subunit [Paraburkholderia aspalathi]|nr:translesion error-prone DNA polymerase V autoproteolytic subunit [Paraburkholderia aspalathi]MBK3780114.1 translesion error-prone DNA polymerase V autoproteolytic subunit [Paraburkholderia aspalathi]
MQSIPVRLPNVPRELTVIDARIPAGQPMPALDQSGRRMDLNDVLIFNPETTFLFEVEGDSMKNEHIYHGDRLVVDRSIRALHGHIVLACIDGEFTVKKLHLGSQVLLMPANPHYRPIVMREGQEMSVWGVVTWNLRQVTALKGLRS